MPAEVVPAEVVVVTMGGTIASPAGDDGGARPRLAGDELVAGLAPAGVRVRAVSFRQFPSVECTIPDLVELVDLAQSAVAGGASGVVVTLGTDTLEEAAFVLDLLWSEDAPLVLTGAMRTPGSPGADGPANLAASMAVAADPELRGVGCLVVLGDEIHAARLVQKTHTASPAAFRSRLGGPVGWVAEGRPRLGLRPVRRHRVAVARPVGAAPPVALVRLGLGDDGRQVRALAGLGYAGAVVEAFGGGHVPSGLVGDLEALARAMPVVLASRTGAGEVLRATYGFPGSERDLLARGLIGAGVLDGLKARLALTLLLLAGTADVAEVFAEVAG